MRRLVAMRIGGSCLVVLTEVEDSGPLRADARVRARGGFWRGRVVTLRRAASALVRGVAAVTGALSRRLGRTRGRVTGRRF